MFAYIFGGNSESYNPVIFVGIIVAFVISFIAIGLSRRFLPHDLGREFAYNGEKSRGKARGAGIIIFICFLISVLLFVRVNAELLIYLGLMAIEMISGFLDDKSDSPWSEKKKAVFDLCVSAAFAVTYLLYNPSVFSLTFIDVTIHINPILYGILITLLVFVSINVTNCTDGVDGLCSSLLIVSFGTVAVLFQMSEVNSDYRNLLVLVIAVLFAYLWFNTSPSSILMGDAGSRPLGFLLALVCVKLSLPLIFMLVCILIIIDGGLGLVKLSLMRIFKRPVMKNLTTPVHDHFRKTLKWSDPKLVIRFTIVQIIINACVIFAAA